MSFTFKLSDWEGNLTEHTISNVEDIKDIIFLVVSGDEMIVVTYKDGYQERFDSTNNRSLSLFDEVRTITLDELGDLH